MDLEATVDDAPRGTSLTMDLEYTGDLWGDSVLSRILDDEVRRGKRALQDILSPTPRR